MPSSVAAIDYKLLTSNPPQLVDAIFPSLSTNEVNNALNFLISLPPNIIESVSLQNVFETLFQKSSNSKYVFHYSWYSKMRIFEKLINLYVKGFQKTRLKNWKIIWNVSLELRSLTKLVKNWIYPKSTSSKPTFVIFIVPRLPTK